MARLATGVVDVVASVCVRRANDYYAACCPLELCESAAARDLWLAMHPEAQ